MKAASGSQGDLGGPVVGVSSMATRQLLTAMAAAYERQFGRRVSVESVGGVDALRRVRDGERFDFVVLAADAMESLASCGRIDAGSQTDFVRSAVAVAVPAGRPRPDIGSEASVRAAVMAARSIGYSTGPSGAHVLRMFVRWGIAEAIAPRIVQAEPGVSVGTLIARGDVELGFQQLSELIDLPGVDVVGLLPRAIEVITVFSAALCTTCDRPAQARALIAFLVSSAGDMTKRRYGMEPA